MGPIRTVSIETQFSDLLRKQIYIFKQLQQFSTTQQELIANGDFEKLMGSLNEKGNLVQSIKKLGKKLTNLQFRLEKSQKPADNKLPANVVADVDELSSLIESVLALENFNLSSLETLPREEYFEAEAIRIKSAN